MLEIYAFETCFGSIAKGIERPHTEAASRCDTTIAALRNCYRDLCVDQGLTLSRDQFLFGTKLR